MARLAVMVLIGAVAFGAAGCVTTGAAPDARPAPAVSVSVDGQAYQVRSVAAEPMLMAVGDSGLQPRGDAGPALRVVGAGSDGILAAHVLRAYCTAAADYRTAAHRSDPSDPSTWLYGEYGDLYWRDAARGEWVFPMADCRT